jgi:hypothetical protein
MLLDYDLEWKHKVKWITIWDNFTLYFFLYNLAAEACANNIWWATKYGSVDEFPLEQLAWKEGEHLCGGKLPRS